MSSEIEPTQPVDQPVLNSPYHEPTAYWEYKGPSATKQPGRRPSAYWYKVDNIDRRGQTALELEEDRRPLVLVNRLRRDVKRWRESGWKGATGVTKALLRHWTRPDRPRRFFFCQIEAVETIIFLNEIRGVGPDGKRGTPLFRPEFTDADFNELHDVPSGGGSTPLTRMCTKLATGSGKTVVMGMLITWAFCNRGRNSSDTRFPAAALICCPNLTILERLKVLRTDTKGENYYIEFDMVPPQYTDLLRTGKVMVTNWHAFKPESPHVEGGRSYGVVNKGAEDDSAFTWNRLKELTESGPIMVLNDEAHHAYRPAPMTEDQIKKLKLSPTDIEEREEATVWVQGLDRIHRSIGIQCCIDLSATPFYIPGSGYPEGEPFPWIVSDFGLMDAIESGITKIPRLPVSDTTGKPDPKYFRLWRNITDKLAADQRLSNKRPKPEVVWDRAEGALQTLAGEYKAQFESIRDASDLADKTMPCMILVCDNTDIAQLFFERISGQTETEDIPDADDITEDGDSDDIIPTKGKKLKKRTVYSDGKVFPELFSNREGVLRTLRIDSKVLDKDDNLREIVNTVGKRGKPGQDVRCVVSVAMLTEGWDANNVTHILGLRAFGSQLLCEQVVGRGLRRMNYHPDPISGLLPEEYVDVYGIPFSVIPYKGKKSNTPPPPPVIRVRALPERAQYEIQFPNVEGYVYALNKPLIRANVADMEPVSIEPTREPTAVFLRIATGYTEGTVSGKGFGDFIEQNRDAYYAANHLQQIEFEIARQVVAALVGEGAMAPIGGAPKMRGYARHQLFPQVLRIVHRFVDTKIHWNGCDYRELGLDAYVRLIVQRMLAAIEPNAAQGEAPLLPLLNRFKPTGTTADVDFTTTRPVHSTVRSHVEAVVLDSSWEQTASFYLEQQHNLVEFYVRNDRPFLLIPYTDHEGISRMYEPDYIVRLRDGTNLLLEVKGMPNNESATKHQGAKRWLSAVNHWGKLGKWDFLESHKSEELPEKLKGLLNKKS